MAQGSTQLRLGSGTNTVGAAFLRNPGDSANMGDGTNPVRIDPTGTTTQPVSGTVAATQSGTWNINNVSGTVSLPTGAATAANQSTEITALQLLDDIVASEGGAFTKVATIGGELDDTSTTAASEDTVSPVRITAQRAMHTNLRDASGTEIATASNPVRIDPTGTTPQPVTQSGTWNITNVSGTVSLPTGASTLAEQQTQTTSLQLIDDTVHATNAAFSKANAIAGQLDDASTTAATEDNVAPVRITAQRAVHMNLRNVAGTEMGTSSNPLQVSLANTGANATPITDNITQINGVSALAGNGVTGTGSLRVTIASDNTAFSVNASGTKTNNNAAPGATNFGTLPGIATAGTQAWTEGNQVALSTDLSGNTRIVANDETASGNITTQNLVPTGTATANSAVEISIVGKSLVAIQVTGTYTGALTPQVTVNGTTWVSAEGGSVLLNMASGAYSATISSATQGIFIFDCAGFNKFRISANAAVTGTAAVTLRASAATGMVSLDNALPAGTASIGNIGTVSTVTTVSTLTGAGVAHDGADSGNPHKMGARATNVEIASVSANNDRTDLVATMTGKLIVQPFSNPENLVSGAITTAMTGITSTSLIAAPGAGLRNYITQITVSNSHATVGTDVVIQDGSGGTTLYTIPATANYGGATITFPVPLRQPTTNTALYCANVTTGSSIKVSASGYKAA